MDETESTTEWVGDTGIDGTGEGGREFGRERVTGNYYSLASAITFGITGAIGCFEQSVSRTIGVLGASKVAKAAFGFWKSSDSVVGVRFRHSS